MPSGSVLFSVSFISANENKLISYEKLSRMTESTGDEEAMKTLYEAGYGGGTTVPSALMYEQLLEKESRQTVELIKNLLPDENTAKCLLIENDYHNMKVLIKSKLDKSDVLPELLVLGTMDVETLKNAVSTDVYTFIPEPMRSACEKIIAAAVSGKVSPSVVDVELDRCFAAEISALIKKSRSHALKKYFTAKFDLKNLETVVRCELLKIPAKDFLIEAGSLSAEFLQGLEGLSQDAFSEKLRYTEYKPFGEILASILSGSERFSAFEIAVDNFLLAIFRARRNDFESEDVIVGYYFAKMSELINVKIVMTGLLAKVDRAKIRGKLRETYV